MIGGNLPKRLPPDASHEMVLRAFRQLQDQLEALSRYVNIREVGGSVPTSVPIPPDFIYGQIFEANSGSGSGVQFDDPGFIDSDGFLAYAFQEIYSYKPWQGILVPGGVITVVPDGVNPGSNFAYPLNDEAHEIGENVILRRAREHWVIVGSFGTAGGSGSGAGGGFIFKCNEDGTGGTITPHRLLGGGGGAVV